MFSVTVPCYVCSTEVVHGLPSTLTLFSHIPCSPFPEPPAGLETVSAASHTVPSVCPAACHSTHATLSLHSFSPDLSNYRPPGHLLSPSHLRLQAELGTVLALMLIFLNRCSWTASVRCRLYEGVLLKEVTLLSQRLLHCLVSVWLSLGILLLSASSPCVANR